MTSPPVRSFPDGGWGWCVVAAYFLISVITDGIRYSFGIMYIAFLDSFGGSRGETAWVGSLMVGTTNFIGPVAGKLVDVYGCRPVVIGGSLISSAGFLFSLLAKNLFHLCITFGVLSGVGFGMIFMSSVVIVSRYFERRRSFAMGVAVCGSGVGAIIFNPLTKWLLDQYGWKGTVLIEAGLLLNCVVFGAIYRPVEIRGRNIKVVNETEMVLVEKNEQKSLTSDESNMYEDRKEEEEKLKGDCSEVEPNFAGESKNPDPSKETICSNLFKFSLLKRIDVWIFLVAGFIASLAYNTPYNFLPDLVLDFSFNRTQAALLMSVIGISNTVSRVLFGWVSDRSFVNRPILFSFTLMATGIFTGLCPLYTLFPLLVMYAVIFGVTGGGYVSLSILVLADLFGVEFITESAGLFSFACGIASYLGSPVAGWLYDGTGSYATTFVVTGLEFFVAGLLLLIIMCRRHRKENSGKNFVPKKH